VPARLSVAASVAVVVVAVVGVAGAVTAADRPAGGPDADTATAARHTGPQGRVGQFVAACTRTHSASDDPIVHPGRPGRSHRHDFYGAEGVDAWTTPARMLVAGTSCDKVADRAAYWHPTVYDHGTPVEATTLSAYYRAAPGVDPDDVEPFPLGLALIAGDMTATAPQPGESVGWTCGTRSALSDAPPDCPVSAPLHLVLVFQDCWDGEHLDSADHRSHAAYSSDGACPSSHPVVLPQLTVAVSLPIDGPGHDLTLSSGSVDSLHGDFFNGWEPAGLEREIDGCIRRDVVCDVRSNRDEPTILDGS
jgi:hypothetical protein